MRNVRRNLCPHLPFPGEILQVRATTLKVAQCSRSEQILEPDFVSA